MSSSGFELADAVETEAKRSTWTESLVLARTEDRCELPRCLRNGQTAHTGVVRHHRCPAGEFRSICYTQGWLHQN